MRTKFSCLVSISTSLKQKKHKIIQKFLITSLLILKDCIDLELWGKVFVLPIHSV